MKILFTLFLLLFIDQYVTGQSIVVVDQENKVLSNDLVCNVTLTLDKTTKVEIKTLHSIIQVPAFNCDSLIEIQIEAPQIKTYYNQYYLHQFQKIDTIRVSNRKIIKGQTPRLLLGNSPFNDSLFEDQRWFKDWYTENENVLSGISFMVNSVEKLSKKQKKVVLEAITDYCVLIDKVEYSSDVTFKHSGYVCRQEDLFNEGTLITKQFIENQNTIEMRQQAENYSIVVTVLIDWK